jgi:hypothetical protein
MFDSSNVAELFTPGRMATGIVTAICLDDGYRIILDNLDPIPLGHPIKRIKEVGSNGDLVTEVSRDTEEQTCFSTRQVGQIRPSKMLYVGFQDSSKPYRNHYLLKTYQEFKDESQPRQMSGPTVTAKAEKGMGRGRGMMIATLTLALPC